MFAPCGRSSSEWTVTRFILVAISIPWDFTVTRCRIQGGFCVFAIRLVGVDEEDEEVEVLDVYLGVVAVRRGWT